jgi:hypothetical protein
VAQLKRELDAQGYRGFYSLMMQATSPGVVRGRLRNLDVVIGVDGHE